MGLFSSQLFHIETVVDLRKEIAIRDGMWASWDFNLKHKSFKSNFYSTRWKHKDGQCSIVSSAIGFSQWFMQPNDQFEAINYVTRLQSFILISSKRTS